MSGLTGSDRKAKTALLGAAMAGLMGVTACGSSTTQSINDPAAKGSVTKTEDKTFTLADFETYCKGRGGVVQLHASCGGSNSCKGASFSFGKLKEHTCRAANTCAGMSCVNLATGTGKTGEQVLQATGSGTMGEGPFCTYCHGDGKTEFKLPVAPGTDLEAARTAFAAKSDTALLSEIAFGLHGIKATGTAYANMPGFFFRYSRDELEKTVTFMKTLPVKAEAWEDPQ